MSTCSWALGFDSGLVCFLRRHFVLCFCFSFRDRIVSAVFVLFDRLIGVSLADYVESFFENKVNRFESTQPNMRTGE